MSLLTDIVVWANAALSTWQRDALRRLFQKQELTEQDFDDLYAMMKSTQERWLDYFEQFAGCR